MTRRLSVVSICACGVILFFALWVALLEPPAFSAQDAASALQQQRITRNVPNYSRFGHAVDVAGNTLVIGSPRVHQNGVCQTGSVYIYTRANANATFTFQVMLQATGGPTQNCFGASVAIDGNTLVVGAPSNSTGQSSGEVFVFTRTGTRWTQQTRFTGSDSLPRDNFGIDVDISGDTVIVGALRHQIGGATQAGQAYVYLRNGTVWIEQGILRADQPQVEGTVGFAVAVDGNTALISSHLEDIAGKKNTGAVYVFGRTGSTWTRTAKLTPTDPQAEDQFGYALALAGDTALIGAPFHSVTQNVGALYVFTRSGQTWTQSEQVAASPLTGFEAGDQGDVLGFSAALSGRTLIGGAPLADGGANRNREDSGLVFIYQSPAVGETYRQIGNALPEQNNETARDDRYGFSVALDNETLLIGIPLVDRNNTPDTGAVVVVKITQVMPTPPTATYTYTPTDTPTFTSTNTPSATDTHTFTPTFTDTPSLTNTPSATFTATETHTPTATDTPTATFTPTFTDTPTVTNTFTAVPETDLSLGITVNRDTPKEGDLVDFTLTVRNESSAPAQRFVVDAPLPRGLSFIDFSGEGLYDTAVGRWEFGALSPGASVSLLLTAAVGERTAGQVIVLTGNFETISPPDNGIANNSARALISPIARGEPNIGSADGKFFGQLCGQPPLVISLGANPVVTHDGYDMVYYEVPYDRDPKVVWLDYVVVEVSDSAVGPWYPVFNWGDQQFDANTSLGAAGYGRGGEINELSIPITVPPFYGILPRATGIAIDVDAVAPPGTYRFVRISTQNNGCRTAEADAIQILPEFGLIDALVLVNSSTDKDILRLNDGDRIDLSNVNAQYVSVRADTIPSQVGSVQFELNGRVVRVENAPPFALEGDTPPGNYLAARLYPGTYTLRAVPFTQPNAQGEPGQAMEITFEIVP